MELRLSANNLSKDADQSKVATARMNLLFRLFLVPAMLVIVQLYHAFTLREQLQGTLGHDLPVQDDHTHPFKPIQKLNAHESFGACLMIKEDNDLLYEWLAYHYTTLPLRYVFVGSDEGNNQNPLDVLQRWKTANTGLHYWVVNATDFMSHPEMGSKKSPQQKPSKNHRGNYTQEHEEAHHAFVHRQRSFITSCVEFMKSKGLQWVTLFDTDEFLVMNRVGEVENITMRQDGQKQGNDPTILDPTAYQSRYTLPTVGSRMTVVDAIHKLERIEDLGSCYTVPRLLYGALENVSCPEASTAVATAKTRFNYDELSTLRFNQHARKGDFAKSKYGKVMLNLSRLSNETIHRTPKNIHRPYKPECGPGAVGNFAESLFYLNHYIGSWERYDSRQDSRRNRVEWELRAHLTDDTSCEHGAHAWFPRFLDLVGEERAQFLLGGNNSIQDLTL
jgi:hypothetical protein